MMKKDLPIFALLLILGIITRTTLHFAPNVEFVTAISLIGGYFFARKKYAILLTILIMSITDLIIGNTFIFIFTWSGFMLPILLGKLLSSKMQNGNLFIRSLNIQILGILSSIFFYLWTNLGVVLMTNMYTKDLSGILLSYTYGLPFLKNQLMSNLVIVPVLFLIVTVYYKYSYSFDTKFNRLFR
jgi:hypothetical protein